MRLLIPAICLVLAGCTSAQDTDPDPGTDEPGVVDPGTDDPGTDDPGTDDPGTDDPVEEPEPINIDHPEIEEAAGPNLPEFLPRATALARKRSWATPSYTLCTRGCP